MNATDTSPDPSPGSSVCGWCAMATRDGAVCEWCGSPLPAHDLPSATEERRVTEWLARELRRLGGGAGPAPTERGARGRDDPREAPPVVPGWV